MEMYGWKDMTKLLFMSKRKAASSIVLKIVDGIKTSMLTIIVSISHGKAILVLNYATSGPKSSYRGSCMEMSL